MGFIGKNYALWKTSADNLYELNDDDILKSHEMLLDMYKDLCEFCDRHSLHLIAGGGTALGAVRHMGFIPWDDDMDLDLIRSEYDVFVQNFSEEMSGKYEICAPGHRNGANCFLARVYRKNTTVLNMIDESSPYPKGIYIDITPIDYAPDAFISQRLKGILVDAVRFISYSVYWYQYPSTSLKEFMIHSEGKIYYKIRMVIGRIFCFWKSEKWFAKFDRVVRGRKSQHVTVGAGRKKYCGELFEKNEFYPLRKARFEDTYIYIFHRVDNYLKRMYGNYMDIPPVEKREKHLCLKFDLKHTVP